MKIEIGKIYWNKKGELRRIIGPGLEGHAPYVFRDHMQWTYTEDGDYDLGFDPDDCALEREFIQSDLNLDEWVNAIIMIAMEQVAMENCDNLPQSEIDLLTDEINERRRRFGYYGRPFLVESYF